MSWTRSERSATHLFVSSSWLWPTSTWSLKLTVKLDNFTSLSWMSKLNSNNRLRGLKPFMNRVFYIEFKSMKGKKPSQDYLNGFFLISVWLFISRAEFLGNTFFQPSPLWYIGIFSFITSHLSFSTSFFASSKYLTLPVRHFWMSVLVVHVIALPTAVKIAAKIIANNPIMLRQTDCLFYFIVFPNKKVFLTSKVVVKCLPGLTLWVYIMLRATS